MISCGAVPEGILLLRETQRRAYTLASAYRRISSVDSRLEAFSGNPTDGSFAALAVQPTA